MTRRKPDKGLTITLTEEPQAENVVMLASWPGIGNVSLILARYLKEKLGAHEIGEIDPVYFFEPVGVMVKDNVVEQPRFPESKFYYWQDDEAKNGVVLFIGEEQPRTKGYEMVEAVLAAAEQLNVNRLYCCAAAVTKIHYTEETKVWGVATTQELLDEFARHNVILRGTLRIAGLNGIILGRAKEKGLEGLCLLGEVPSFATQMAHPKAALAVLSIFAEMLGIEVDTEELEALSKQSEMEMDAISKQATAAYIDQFTEPIWEQEGEESGDEEDDESDDDDEGDFGRN
ncbi:MAG: PAC2 family protein [Dehalococcoidia bacterium]|nr:PAC2 family protein [Dehalococcoidia bacterium]